MVARGETVIILALVYKQGVTASVGNDIPITCALPVSYSAFFVPVTGFGRGEAWGPIYSALTVCKNGLTSIALRAHESCSTYVITIGI